MSLVGQLSSTCKTAREQICLHLDGELSEFEQVALQAHLRQCAACCAYAASLADVTARIRSSPLEQPEFPITLPRPSRIRVPLNAVRVAAAAVVIAVIGSSAAGVTPGRERSFSGRSAAIQADPAPNLAAPRGKTPTVDVFIERRTAPRPVRGRTQMT